MAYSEIDPRINYEGIIDTRLHESFTADVSRLALSITSVGTVDTPRGINQLETPRQQTENTPEALDDAEMDKLFRQVVGELATKNIVKLNQTAVYSGYAN